ncbi:MAG: glycosyltransferase family 39 protein, partial [Bdellovibrionales bacterium]|nr:glycosyltransferase family 39 protein [Bdellovibrionales bacterium]
LAGSASSGLVYFIGRLIFSSGVGVYAALLLAVFPLHVTCSRYLKEDSLLTFFFFFSTLFAVFVARTKNSRWLILSGIAAGCSTSVKYSGMLSAGIPVLAAMYLEQGIPRDSRVWKHLILALILVPIAFVACSPYVVLDSVKFQKDFQVEQSHMENGHYFAIDAWSQYWSYHLQRSLIPGVTLFPVLVGLLGIGVLIVRGNAWGVFCVLLFMAYYLPAEYVKAKPAPQPERYILPTLPFFALLVGEGVRVLFKDSLVRFVVGLLVVAMPLVRTVQLLSEIAPDTRIQMNDWMMTNIPKGAHVYVDHKRYSPEISEEYFAVTYAPRATIHQDLDARTLQKLGQEYLLISSLWYDRYFSQPRTDEGVRRKLTKLFQDLEVVKEMRPKYGTYGFHNPTVTLFRVAPAAQVVPVVPKEVSESSSQ